MVIELKYTREKVKTQKVKMSQLNKRRQRRWQLKETHGRNDQP